VKILNHMKTVFASEASAKTSAFLNGSQSSKLNPNYSEQIMNCIAFFNIYIRRENRNTHRGKTALSRGEETEKKQTLNQHTRKAFFSPCSYPASEFLA